MNCLLAIDWSFVSLAFTPVQTAPFAVINDTGWTRKTNITLAADIAIIKTSADTSPNFSAELFTLAISRRHRYVFASIAYLLLLTRHIKLHLANQMKCLLTFFEHLSNWHLSPVYLGRHLQACRDVSFSNVHLPLL